MALGGDIYLPAALPDPGPAPAVQSMACRCGEALILGECLIWVSTDGVLCWPCTMQEAINSKPAILPDEIL